MQHSGEYIRPLSRLLPDNTPVAQAFDARLVTHMLPGVPGAGGSIQGFIRITNASDLAGEVEIYAIDDAGHRYGPVTLSIDAYQTRHFNSDDLERGAPSKGIFAELAVGLGCGVWT